MNKTPLWIVALCIFIMVSCSVKPEPIAFGEDHCTYCRMNIADPKFGAELVTAKGKVFKFDAVECMVPYLQKNSAVDYSHVLAIAYDEPGELKPVANLKFAFSDRYKSPMGGNLAALHQSTLMEDGLESLDWQQIKVHSFKKH